jgi:hypothetical protein
MKLFKWVVIALFVYVGIVIAFESLIGYFQPANESTLVITTLGADQEPSDRVLARIESNGQIYVSANHWPRAWYDDVLENPDVYVALDREKAEYLAVPVTGEEADRVERENRHPILFRIVTGFPPRYFIRLDPR